MAFDAGSVIAKIKADLTEFKSGLDDAKNSVSSWGSSIKTGVDGMNSKIKEITPQLREASLAFAAVGAAGVLTLKSWVDGANQQNQVNAQLTAVLKSTGNAAGLSAKQIQDMAGALESQTTIGNEAIQSGQNILLTFTNIKKDAFEPATQAMLDMATAMNGGVTPGADQLRNTAVELGKALNDPTVGAVALRRVGVSLTQQQMDQIKTLQANNDMMGAQKIILDEVSKEFGGSAAAAATTYEGKMEQLQNRFGDFTKQLGEQLLPLFSKLLDIGNAVMAWFESLSPSVQKFIAIGVLLGTVLASVAAPLLLFVTFIPGIIAGFTALAPLIAAIISPIGLLVIFLGALAIAWETNFLGIRDKTQVFVQMILDLFELFKMAWDNDWGNIRDIAVVAFDVLKGMLQIAWDALNLIFKTALALLTGNWSIAWLALKQLALDVFTLVGQAAGAFWDSIKGLFSAGGALIATAWSNMITGIQNVAASLWTGIKQMFTDGLNWLIDQINSAVSMFNSAVSHVTFGAVSHAVPSVPHLASGGIVTSPTFALIGESGPEAVVPLSGNNAAGIGGVHIHIDGAIIGSVDAAVDLLDMAMRRVRPNLGV